ncbi:hypothetical protein RE735_16480 [Bacillus aerius]|nr:hypothetical protein [Bacillus aerius]WMT28659.1 hypothetical protein RE735_16480 [Bacillus aerius]
MIGDAAIVDIDPMNHTASFRIALHGPEHSAMDAWYLKTFSA